ncbi:MAG: NADH-quinone oxidoreductase subunit N [Planctomycetaceae bacterium]|nr:NADH-quinone oxidoreductase subunit N [Planctomycetaceae bacterium]
MFSQLIDSLIQETTTRSLPFFGAELCLSVTIVLMLLLRLFNADRWVPSYLVAVVGAFASLWATYRQFTLVAEYNGVFSETFFSGMLIQDLFSVYFRGFLSLFLLLTIALTALTGIPDNEDGPDFYSLLFGATIGMMLMASANNLLILFLGVEMASVPSYAMVGFLKGRKPSSEAALKYVVYGAGAAGVMLYGVSLLAGVLGTGDMSAIASRLTEAAAGGTGGLSDPEIRTVTLGVLLIMVGLAFKLSLVPFHFWCPDAFEGASAEVAGFLSVASKAGAFGLLVRLCLALSGATGVDSLLTAFGIGLGVIACITTTYGNLAAYAQTNMKRLLAYSTIAHAGYMLMAVSAMMVLQNSGSASDYAGTIRGSLEGLLYYLAVYMFMNLGAFAVIALCRNHTFSEDIDSVKGLISQSPVLCITMLVCCFSLVGMPPFGGFFAKLMIFAAALKAGEVHWFMYVVVAFGGLNTVLSLYYYLKILKTMFLDERPEGARPVPVNWFSYEGAYAGVLGLFVVLLGLLPQIMTGLTNTASVAAESVASF